MAAQTEERKKVMFACLSSCHPTVWKQLVFLAHKNPTRDLWTLPKTSYWGGKSYAYNVYTLSREYPGICSFAEKECAFILGTAGPSARSDSNVSLASIFLFQLLIEKRKKRGENTNQEYFHQESTFSINIFNQTSVFSCAWTVTTKVSVTPTLLYNQVSVHPELIYTINLH